MTMHNATVEHSNSKLKSDHRRQKRDSLVNTMSFKSVLSISAVHGMVSSQGNATFTVVPMRRALRAPDKLDLTRSSGYKFRSVYAKGACRSAPRNRNVPKSALLQGYHYKVFLQ
ncbi:hypothetical protein TNCV_1400571 [Trichonephila clavipes]|nr:hypothetical protein TNCV_1400571 [Trichonephila clavipes]